MNAIILSTILISCMYFIVHLFAVGAPVMIGFIQQKILFKYVFFITVISIIYWAFFYKGSQTGIIKVCQETVVSTPFFWVINFLVLIAAKILTAHQKEHLFPLVYFSGITLAMGIYYFLRAR